MNSSANLKNFSFLQKRPNRDTIHAVIKANESYDKVISIIQYYNFNLTYLLDDFEMGEKGPYILLISDHFMNKNLFRNLLDAQKQEWLKLEQGDMKDILLDIYTSLCLQAQSLSVITAEERSFLWSGLPLNKLSPQRKREIHISLLGKNLSKTAIEELTDIDGFFELYRQDTLNVTQSESTLLF